MANIPQDMYDLSRMKITNEESIKNWYISFETIHHFSDGNGRVGGIILAAYSKYNLGTIIAPCQ
jgi:fido (protein-threonine AMPylation protein)